MFAAAAATPIGASGPDGRARAWLEGGIAVQKKSRKGKMQKRQLWVRGDTLLLGKSTARPTKSLALAEADFVPAAGDGGNWVHCARRLQRPLPPPPPRSSSSSPPPQAGAAPGQQQQQEFVGEPLVLRESGGAAIARLLQALRAEANAARARQQQQQQQQQRQRRGTGRTLAHPCGCTNAGTGAGAGGAGVRGAGSSSSSSAAGVAEGGSSGAVVVSAAAAPAGPAGTRLEAYLQQCVVKDLDTGRSMHISGVPTAELPRLDTFVAPGEDDPLTVSIRRTQTRRELVADDDGGGFDDGGGGGGGDGRCHSGDCLPPGFRFSEFTEYVINVSMPALHHSWLTPRRFRHFLALRDELRAGHPELFETAAGAPPLPPLPPKRLFGKMDAAVVAERHTALEAHLQHCVRAAIAVHTAATKAAARRRCRSGGGGGAEAGGRGGLVEGSSEDGGGGGGARALSDSSSSNEEPPPALLPEALAAWLDPTGHHFAVGSGSGSSGGDGENPQFGGGGGGGSPRRGSTRRGAHGSGGGSSSSSSSSQQQQQQQQQQWSGALDVGRLNEMLAAPLPVDWLIDFGEIVVGEKVAAGGAGQVYSAHWRDQHVAVKELYRTFREGEECGELLHEASVLRRLKAHGSVVTFLGVSLHNVGFHDMGNEFRAYLVTEYCPHTLSKFTRLSESSSGSRNGGGGAGVLDDDDVGLTGPEFLSLCRQIAGGMAFLHAEGVVHRDLKPDNVLLDEAGSARICDVGLATVLEHGGVAPLASGKQVTPAFTAPELLRKDSAYTPKVDVFSFGILAWCMWARADPYRGVATHSINHLVEAEGLRPALDAFPPGLAELLGRCWAADPDARPSFEEIVQHLDAQGELLITVEVVDT